MAPASVPRELACSGQKKKQTEGAIGLAQKSAEKAKSLLSQGDSATTELATQLFGPDQLADLATLVGNVASKVGQLKTRGTDVAVVCGPAGFQLCASDTLAVVPEEPLDEVPGEVVVMCPAFFKKVKGSSKANASQERARTVLHETVHLLLTDEPDVYLYQRLFSVLPELGGGVALRNPDTVALFIQRAASGVESGRVAQEIAARRPPADRLEGFTAAESLLVRSALGVVSATAGDLADKLQTVIDASQGGMDFGPSLKPFLALATSVECGLLARAPSIQITPRTKSDDLQRAKVLANLVRFNDAQTGSHNVDVEMNRRGFTLKKAPSGSVTFDGASNEIKIGPGGLPGFLVRSAPVILAPGAPPRLEVEAADRVDQGTIGLVVRRLALPLVRGLSHLGDEDIDQAIAILIERHSQTALVSRISPEGPPGAVLDRAASAELGLQPPP